MTKKNVVVLFDRVFLFIAAFYRKNYDKTVRRVRLREIRNVKYMTKA